MYKNNKYRYFTYLACFLAVYLVSPIIHAKECPENTLIFAANESISPYFIQENESASGIVFDIAKQLESYISEPTCVIGMNWAQAQEQILEGGVDALLHINTNPEREKILDFSTELVASEFHLFVHRDSNFDENNIDLNNMIIGVEAKGYPYSYLKRNDIPLALVSSWEEGMRGVINGDIDAVLVDHLVGMNTIFNSRIANLKSIPSPLPKSYSRIAVKKGNDLILDQINKGLAILYADGTIDRSIKNWMTPSIQMVEQLWHEQERVKTQNIGLIILSLLTLLCLIAFVKSRMTISSELDKNKDLNRALKGAYTELQDKNEALADANQNLETFVSLASHDMRAPLNGMKNLIQWAEEDLATDNHNNVREHLSLLKSRSTRLSNLLSDLLIFFRADKHSADSNELIDPNLCARELVNNFDSPLNVNIIIAPNAKLHVSRTLFELVLSNLIKNSILHSGEDSDLYIKLEFKQLNASLEMTFSDSGKGINEDQLNLIFMPFEVGQSRDKSEGSGIGLALVRRVIEQNNGSIELTEHTPSTLKGAVFKCTFNESSIVVNERANA